MNGDHVSGRKLNPSLAVSESGFVFLPTTGETFTVNECGRTILRALQESRTIDEITQALLANYDTDQASIERDVSDFIGQLAQYNLMTQKS